MYHVLGAETIDLYGLHIFVLLNLSNRPGVTGAVLQAASLVIRSLGFI